MRAVKRLAEQLAMSVMKQAAGAVSGERRTSEQTVGSRFDQSDRRVFPCYFGSALHTEGVEELLDALESLTEERQYPAKFGAKVYKIGRDEQGNRLTYLKVTGGAKV